MLVGKDLQLPRHPSPAKVAGGIEIGIGFSKGDFDHGRHSQ